jgi:hypothetical protein
MDLPECLKIRSVRMEKIHHEDTKARRKAKKEKTKIGHKEHKRNKG